MSCCEHKKTEHKNSESCPSCKAACKSVTMRTLYHQVSFPENLKIGIDQYYFCADKNCAIAYFSLSGLSIAKQVLRSADDLQNAKLCYCFDIDVADYKAALQQNTAELIKQFVVEKTQAGDCACVTRNPSGKCCLADFKQLEIR